MSYEINLFSIIKFYFRATHTSRSSIIIVIHDIMVVNVRYHYRHFVFRMVFLLYLGVVCCSFCLVRCEYFFLLIIYNASRINYFSYLFIYLYVNFKLFIVSLFHCFSVLLFANICSNIDSD